MSFVSLDQLSCEVPQLLQVGIMHLCASVGQVVDLFLSLLPLYNSHFRVTYSRMDYVVCKAQGWGRYENEESCLKAMKKKLHGGHSALKEGQ